MQARIVHRTTKFRARTTAKKVVKLFFAQQLGGIFWCTIHQPSFSSTTILFCRGRGCREGLGVELGVARWTQIVDTIVAFDSKTAGDRGGLFCHMCQRATHQRQATTTNHTFFVATSAHFPARRNLLTGGAF
jgi:hypothetical protein